MTVLTPVIIIGIYLLAGLIIYKNEKNEKNKTVAVVDNTQVLMRYLDSAHKFIFVKVASETEAGKGIAQGTYDAYLLIKDRSIDKLDSTELISKKSFSIIQNGLLSSHLESKIYNLKLQKLGLSKSKIDSAKTSVNIAMKDYDEKGQKKTSSSSLKSAIGFGLSILIYMFVFIYGAMIMRSVMEEKTNRIVEVIVSSIKPFQLMMGKILGIAAVGLTQIGLWIIIFTSISLTFGVSSAVSAGSGNIKNTTVQLENLKQNPKINSMMSETLAAFSNLPFMKILVVFLLCFILGYLLYSSLFAAIGSAVNQETDAQQFMVPVSLPLMFGFIIAQAIVFQDPHGTIAKIFTYIPLTTPVLLPIRAAFDAPWWEIILATTLLAATFIFVVWLAARIYRVGILMYGKKPSWKDLAKWIFIK